jgi:hypothetical protein
MAVMGALEFFWWIIFVVIWAIFIFFTMQIARSKGYGPFLWGLMACFLPLITVIILLLLPDRTGRYT